MIYLFLNHNACWDKSTRLRKSSAAVTKHVPIYTTGTFGNIYAFQVRFVQAYSRVSTYLTHCLHVQNESKEWYSHDEIQDTSVRYPYLDHTATSRFCSAVKQHGLLCGHAATAMRAERNHTPSRLNTFLQQNCQS